MQVNRPSYNATPIFNNISAPAAVGFISGVNRALPFGYNPMLNPMFALAQTLGPSLAQFLSSLSSLFGNKNGSASSAAASRGSSGSQSTPPSQPWRENGAEGCKDGCGRKNSQGQGTQRTEDPSRGRSELPEPRRDSPEPTKAPEKSSGADDHAGHDHP